MPYRVACLACTQDAQQPQPTGPRLDGCFSVVNEKDEEVPGLGPVCSSSVIQAPHVRQQQAARHIPLDDKWVVEMISSKTAVLNAGFSRDDVDVVIQELGLKLYCCQQCGRYRLTDPEQRQKWLRAGLRQTWSARTPTQWAQYVVDRLIVKRGAKRPRLEPPVVQDSPAGVSTSSDGLPQWTRECMDSLQQAETAFYKCDETYVLVGTQALSRACAVFNHHNGSAGGPAHHPPPNTEIATRIGAAHKMREALTKLVGLHHRAAESLELATTALNEIEARILHGQELADEQENLSQAVAGIRDVRAAISYARTYSQMYPVASTTTVVDDPSLPGSQQPLINATVGLDGQCRDAGLRLSNMISKQVDADAKAVEGALEKVPSTCAYTDSSVREPFTTAKNALTTALLKVTRVARRFPVALSNMARERVRRQANDDWGTQVTPQCPILRNHEMAPEVKLQFMQIAQLAQLIQCGPAEARRLCGAYARVASCALVGYTGRFLGMPLLTANNGVQTCSQQQAPPRPWVPDDLSWF